MLNDGVPNIKRYGVPTDQVGKLAFFNNNVLVELVKLYQKERKKRD